VGTLLGSLRPESKDNQTYYKTGRNSVTWRPGLCEAASVPATVGAGLYRHKGSIVDITLWQEKLNLKETYDGSDPCADTFRDGGPRRWRWQDGHDGRFSRE
jgi:hypothetical protein